METRCTTAGPRRGFTLLELMLVVSMMAILAAFSLSKSSRILESWRITRASQAYSEELQQAFALVGRNRRPIEIDFDTDSMTLYLKGRTGMIYRRRYLGPASEYKLTSTSLQFSVPALSLSPHVYRLEVYPPGLAADSLSVVISGNFTSRRVRMLRGGLVQICSTGDKTKC